MAEINQKPTVYMQLIRETYRSVRISNTKRFIESSSKHGGKRGAIQFRSHHHWFYSARIYTLSNIENRRRNEDGRETEADIRLGVWNLSL